MHMIEIYALENGAHRNQTYHGFLPNGWAVIPDELGELKNFPFGEVEVEEWDAYTAVVKWIPGVMPEPEPEPDHEPEETSVWDELDAAYREGVNTAYDQ